MAHSIRTVVAGIIRTLALAVVGSLLTPLCIFYLFGFESIYPNHTIDEFLATHIYVVSYYAAPAGAIYGGIVGVGLTVASLRWPSSRRWMYMIAGTVYVLLLILGFLMPLLLRAIAQIDG
jgi:hypothetical protein